MKTYILDTNVILNNPEAIFGFSDNEVVLSLVVIEELEAKKNVKGEIGRNARSLVNILSNLTDDFSNDKLLKGIELEGGGILRIEDYIPKESFLPYKSNSPDMLLLGVCLHLSEKSKETILITNDNYLRLKASLKGVRAETYKNESVETNSYNGRIKLYTGKDNLNLLYNDKEKENFSMNELYTEDGEVFSDFVENQYVHLVSEDGEGLAIYRENKLIAIKNNLNFMKGKIEGRNMGQKYFIHALKESPSIAPLVITKGQAGTGKTLLAIAAGIDGVTRGVYHRILYLRGNTKLDEDIGFLPGTEDEKLEWALRPVRDNLDVIYEDSKNKTEEINRLFEERLISIEAVAHMRGRSLAHTFVIIDEAQNLNPRQVKTLLSRAASGTKIVLMGDPYQIDTPYLDIRTNGLCYASDRMKGSKYCYQIGLKDGESERSPLALEIFSRME